jgi:hypothetical protein
VGLKQYRDRWSPVSTIADNEHTTAALGYSKVLSVQHSVGPPIPEFCQPPEDGPKVSSTVRRQDTGDVLPYHPTGLEAVSQSKKLKGQVATIVGQSLSETGDTEGLAGGATNQHVNWVIVSDSDRGKVTSQRHVRIVM